MVRSYKVPEHSDERNLVEKWRMGREIPTSGIRCEEMCVHGVHLGREDSGMLREIF